MVIRRAMLRWLLVATTIAALARDACAWQTVITPSYGVDGAGFVAFDPDRNVVAAGHTLVSGDTPVLTVVELGQHGNVRWLTRIDPRASRVSSLALDAAGDVYIAGAVGGYDETYFGRFAVVKLDGRTGIERWRFVPEDGFAWSVGADPAGDVIATGWVTRPCDCNGGCAECGIPLTIKLDGASGAERWRDETRAAMNLVVLEDGDFILADAVVTRCDGATGAVRWEMPVAWPNPNSSGLPGAVVDPAGDLLVRYGKSVAKLSGLTGAVRWLSAVPGLDALFARINGTTTDAAGDVLLAAAANGDGYDTRFAVIKLGGVDGTERWRRIVASAGSAAASSVATDAANDIVAIGQTERAPYRRSFTIIKLSSETGNTRWERHLTGSGCGGGGADVALDRAGNVGAAGSLCFEDGTKDYFFAVARLSGRSGGGLNPLRLRSGAQRDAE